MEKTWSEGVLVAETESMVFRNSRIHGTGGFARRDICKGEQVIEYVGEPISKQESLRRCEANNEYIFTLSDELDVDGNVVWNPARFINHSCAPNCDAEVEADQIWIIANRDIKAVEEITFYYACEQAYYRVDPSRC